MYIIAAIPSLCPIRVMDVPRGKQWIVCCPGCPRDSATETAAKQLFASAKVWAGTLSSHLVPPGLSIPSGAQRCVCCWEVFCKTPGKHTWASFLPVGFQYLVKMRSWSWGTCTAPSAFCPCVAGQSHLIKLSLTVLAFYTAAATPKDAVKPCRNQRRASKW